MAMAYADIFTGYPDHLLMNRDLASFVSGFTYIHTYVG